MNNAQTGSDVLGRLATKLIKKAEFSVQALNLVIYKQYADFNFGKQNGHPKHRYWLSTASSAD